MSVEYDRLGWALQIAARGFFIHPLMAGSKRPFPNVSWKNLRTTDPARIKAWFAETPDMNYGVSPGSGGGIIDIDTKKADGLALFDKLEREQDPVDVVRGQTFTVTSPSLGMHLYLLTDEPITNHSGFGAGIDVRGESGYVVGPGCYYDGKEKAGDTAGFYTVMDESPFMRAPSWVTQRMRAEILGQGPQTDIVELDLESNISQAKQYLTKRLPAIEGMAGGGDLHTYTTCCVLCHNFALSRETAIKLLADWKFRLPTDPEDYEGSWNDRCEPPWDVYGSGNETLETKIRNADAYGKMRRGEASGAVMLQGLDLETVAMAEAAALQAVEEGDEKRRRLIEHLLRGSEIFNRIKPVHWVIPFWFPGAGITGIVGESGIGKSTVLLDLALTVSHDLDWHENTTRKGYTVVYACGEDYEGASIQIRAWCKAKGLQTPNADRFVFIPAVPPLASMEEVNLWIDVLKEKVGKKNVMVFIDTWQRATVGLSQNDEREMQGSINMAEAVGRALGGPVVVAFHSPKSNRDTIAGWEGQRNTANALWYLERDQRGVKLEARKVRGGARGASLVLEYVEYDTGLKDEYFNFPIKHVVPHRLGGHRITFDGQMHKEENLGEVAKVLAEVLYELEHRRADDTSAPKPYTTRHAAERIVGSPEHPTFGRAPIVEADDEWSTGLRTKLESAKLKFPMALADMELLIRQCLNHTGVVLENGHKVYLMTMGNKQHVMVADGGLTAPTA